SYDRQLFRVEDMRHLLGEWLDLLQHMLADPCRRLDTLEILAPEERQLLLNDWNATCAEYPRTLCVHQLFEERVAQSPDRVAVTHDATCLTYGALNELASHLAGHLSGLGVGPEICVGICLERSPEMLIALLGILKAGGAYVPLDPAQPPARLAFVPSGARILCLIARARLLKSAIPGDVHVLCLEHIWDDLVSARPSGVYPARAEAEN